ncbi:MAG: hypothetical protein H6502_02635 [Candidatus Woesearchaeota archaeon]|nr:MAG: hypothetical protein H6502_02635 [Candidatus Woesearchaeota archaeon]
MDPAFDPKDEFTEEVASFELEMIDMLKMKEYYKMAHDYLAERGWSDPEGQGDKFETYYFEQIDPKGSKFHFIWWRLDKYPAATKNSKYKYMKFYMIVDLKTLVLRDAEKVVDGKKIKGQDGDIIWAVKSYLIKDLGKQFRNHWFLKMFHKKFHDVWYSKTIDQAKKELWNETYRFHERLRQFMRLKHSPHITERPEPAKGL